MAMSEGRRIETLLAGLFPPGTAVAALWIKDNVEALFPEEEAAIATAIPRRRAEFAAGRAAARRALLLNGQPPCPIPVAADRAPLWPRGFSGSIAHADGLAIAVARKGLPLGVDVEDDADVESDLWPLVCTAEELDSLPAKDPGRTVRKIFSAKEAAYKAQYGVTGRMIGFDALSIRIAGAAFSARFLEPVGAFAPGASLEGRIAHTPGFIFSGVAL